jgi:hypothetical protein
VRNYGKESIEHDEDEVEKPSGTGQTGKADGEGKGEGDARRKATPPHDQIGKKEEIHAENDGSPQGGNKADPKAAAVWQLTVRIVQPFSINGMVASNGPDGLNTPSGSEP